MIFFGHFIIDLPLQIGAKPAQGRPLNLHVVKDDGHSYYGASRLDKSPSALGILSAAKHLPDAFACMPLLLTPSQTILLESLSATEVAVDHYCETATTDGAVDIGTEEAWGRGGKIRKCDKWQIEFFGILNYSCLCDDGLS